MIAIIVVTFLFAACRIFYAFAKQYVEIIWLQTAWLLSSFLATLGSMFLFYGSYKKAWQFTPTSEAELGVALLYIRIIYELLPQRKT